jgi:hypothetical protein
MPLPIANIEQIVYLFTTFSVTLAIFWSINKAIFIAKSH